MSKRIPAVAVVTLAAVIGGAPTALADDPVVAGTDAAGVQYLPEETRTVVVTPPPTEQPPPPPPTEVAPVVTPPPETTTAPSVSPPPPETQPVVDEQPKVAPEEKPVQDTVVKPAADTPEVQPKATPTANVAAATTPTSGGLPFTGYDALPVAAGGLLLLLLGVALRRQAREQG